MRNKINILCYILLSSCLCYSQENFDIEHLSGLLIEQVNELRIENELDAFINNEVLEAVAFDQAAYILKTGQLTHEQTNKKKENLSARILYYEGLNSQSGENIAQIGLNSKVVLEKGRPKQLADNSEKMLRGAILSWQAEKDGNLNLLDPNFSQYGISIIGNDKNELIIVLVMASMPFETPSGAKVSFNNYGIENYSKETCDAFITEHGSSAQLFSDALIVKNNKLSFEFHSLAFFDELISNSNDGLTVELVSKDQFDCYSSNQLFPGDIADGYLMKPFYKAKLSSLNGKELDGKVEIDLGDLPSFYNSETHEINGMILKDGKKCVSIPFNRVETENVRWLKIPFLTATSEKNSLKNRLDTSTFRFNFNQFDRQILEIKTFLNGIDYKVSGINLNAKIAPFGINEAELRSKLESNFSEFVSEKNPIQVKIEVDWNSYLEFKEGTYYQLETKDMNKEQELSYLEDNIKKDEKLKIGLESIGSFELLIHGVIGVRNSMIRNDRLNLLSTLVKLDKIDLALEIQKELILEAKSGRRELDLLVTGNQEQLKNTLPLINNQIVAQHEMNSRQFDGNPIHIAFLELYLINPNNAVISYNYHLATLQHWSRSVKNIIEIDKWKKGFEKLRLSVELSSEAYNKTYLNFLVIAADYYYEKASFDKRKKAFDEILKYAVSAKLGNKDYLSIAKYLCHQDQFPRAVRMLLPIVKEDKVDENLLHYFLQIAIYDKYQVDESLYISLIDKAKNDYPNSFCSLFSKKKMGIQQLKNQEIKKLYCEQCVQ